MIYQTAKEAIARSISHDEITFCADSEENRDYLAASSDDYVECNGCIEYWADADDSDGCDGNMEWRVHIAVEE